MKFLLLACMLFLQASLLAQSISFSKDSLYVTTDFGTADTLVVYNYGQSDLIIDSIKTEHYYSYRLYVLADDSTTYHVLMYGEPPISFTIASQDSVVLIISDPDLCPICDSPSGYENFTDTFTVYSNSTLTNEYSIFVTGNGYTDAEFDEIFIQNFELYQNYPNPFNPTTNISYSLSKSGFVKLKIFNLLGEEVATLVDGYQKAGIHSIKFDAKMISSGVYIYKLNSNKLILTKKMILLR